MKKKWKLIFENSTIRKYRFSKITLMTFGLDSVLNNEVLNFNPVSYFWLENPIKSNSNALYMFLISFIATDLLFVGIIIAIVLLAITGNLNIDKVCAPLAITCSHVGFRKGLAEEQASAKQSPPKEKSVV